MASGGLRPQTSALEITSIFRPPSRKILDPPLPCVIGQTSPTAYQFLYMTLVTEVLNRLLPKVMLYLVFAIRFTV